MEKHDPMDEAYWKKKIEKSIKRIRKDKLITENEMKDLVQRIRKA